MRPLAPALALLVAMAAPASQAAPICSDVFARAPEERLAEISPAMASLLDSVSHLDPKLIGAEATPTWNDFYRLKTTILALREAKKALADETLLRETEEILRQLARKDDSPLTKLATAKADHRPTGDYKPTEYELKLLYQFEIAKLNRELPRDARIPLQRLPLDARRAKFASGIQDLMTKLRTSFESRFATTGYPTYADYVKAVRASEDPLIKHAVEMIDTDQVQMVIRRPENARFWVPKVGFHNQYVTGTSKGTNDPQARREAETRLYARHDGVNDVETAISEYSRLDPELAPKYGTLMPSRESNLRWETSSGHYGQDVYVLKKDRIANRTTFTFSDSLGHGWMRGPRTSWDATFIPWDSNLLLVQGMVEGLKAGQFGTPMAAAAGNLKYTLRPGYYWEIQILGPLNLKDVSEFHFTSNPPNGQFLLDLLKHGIAIRDARVGGAPGVEWIPTEEMIRAAQKDENP